MKIAAETVFQFREKSEKIYEIDYGNLKKGSDTKVEVLFKNAQHLMVKKSCGCTLPTVEIISSDSFKLTVQYDSKKTGTINQWVKETLIDKETGKEEQVKIELKGSIS